MIGISRVANRQQDNPAGRVCLIRIIRRNGEFFQDQVGANRVPIPWGSIDDKKTAIGAISWVKGQGEQTLFAEIEPTWESARAPRESVSAGASPTAGAKGGPKPKKKP